MGEVIRISDYLDRKAAETDPAEITRRLAEIGREVLLLTSEKHRLEAQLFQPPTTE